MSELTKLSLFESFALPVLMYCLDVLFLCPVEMRKLNVCWNSIYRRIFNFHRWESVKVLKLMCERLDLTHILDKIKLKFYHRLHRCDSAVLQYCLSMSKYCKTRLTALFPGLPGSAGTRKVKPIWILLKLETVSDSSISWAT